MGQIADLFVGDSLALEVQCSRLSQQRLRERTCAYHQAGYEVRWLLGEELWLNGRLTDLQRDFLYFRLRLDFTCGSLIGRKRKLDLSISSMRIFWESLLLN